MGIFCTGWCAGKAFEHAWKSDRTEYSDDHLLCPGFTAGAAMTALYTMVMRMARKEDGKIISEYFKAFKANLNRQPFSG